MHAYLVGREVHMHGCVSGSEVCVCVGKEGGVRAYGRGTYARVYGREVYVCRRAKAPLCLCWCVVVGWRHVCVPVCVRVSVCRRLREGGMRVSACE